MNIIKHYNKWYWGPSVISITDDGLGTATCSVISEYEYKEGDAFRKVERCVISSISVHESARRKGYGNVLLTECEKEAEKMGFDKVYLWAELDSVAYNWYLRHGYVVSNKMSLIPTDDDTEAVIQLEKSIN